MPVVDVKVYYLEMHAHPGTSVAPPRGELTVAQARKPSVDFYRFLYNSVGREYNWFTRGRMADEQLGALLADPGDEVHVLYVEGNPAGFAELDCRQPRDVELVQFGLLPRYIGQGLGKYFLQWTIDKVWSRGPERFWLHTCTEDHPRALPNYLAAGFTLYKEELTRREV